VRVRLEKCLLSNVLGICEVASDQERDANNQSLVPTDELFVGIELTMLGTDDQLRISRRARHSRRTLKETTQASIWFPTSGAGECSPPAPRARVWAQVLPLRAPSALV
jgi:hypothetical protein